MATSNTQFSIAVHVLAGIAKVGTATSKQLAGSVNTSPIFLKRILAKLSKAGLIETTQGRAGGCVLSRSAEKISLFDAYLAVETPQAFAVHSYAKTKSCEISSNIQDAMTKVLDDVQSAVEKKLRSKSIADILKEMKTSR